MHQYCWAYSFSQQNPCNHVLPTHVRWFMCAYVDSIWPNRTVVAKIRVIGQKLKVGSGKDKKVFSKYDGNFLFILLWLTTTCIKVELNALFKYIHIVCFETRKTMERQIFSNFIYCYLDIHHWGFFTMIGCDNISDITNNNSQ